MGWYDTDFGILELISNFTLEFLFPVTLLTYFLIQIEHQYLKKHWYIWLYIPIILSTGIEICIVVSQTLFNVYDVNFDDLVFDIKNNTAIIYNLFLIFWGRYLVKKSSTISKDKKLWLLRLNLYIIFIIFLWLFSNIEFYLFDSEHTTNLMWFILSTLLWWVLYYGVFKLQLVVQKDEIHQYLVSKKTNTNLPKKDVNQNEISKIVSQLYALMEDEELYKNPLLSRLDLANRLETSEGNLSKIINQEINKSVIQFVNDYRIESAKNLLHNPVFDKYSVEAIGMEAGFKSKSAFYNVFKNSLGISPGAYRKQNKVS
ncbi:hypothetical protein GCM10011444_17930 [Winogradskyella haliclonae]|uniref:HTH araC/xylS-type domain-containing protein n=2 Tax=Winogradskyella haliclonae TaxID=2048558 RepID=A0ABQ2BY95_9FLAO|nr:hypothetical protein GCM10011444_17930 [Winogradskyella haliclonae]